MIEINIPKKDVEKYLNNTYNIIAKGTHKCLMSGIYTMRFIMIDMTDYTEKQIEILKNEPPTTKGEKIENDFITLGDFCGGVIGGFLIPLIYYANPEIKMDTLEEFMVWAISTPFTLDAGQIAGAYAGKKLAYIPKKTIDNVLTPTYDIITDKIKTRISTTSNKIYDTIKENITVTVK
ncbi:MAG: hypothetical protein GQ477_05130 [Nanohaloarchaea archaeon]|nr:hypothetical protein [Candidatus Nanohaloarchaea archaeon]